MWIARLNTNINKYADYVISRNKMCLVQYEFYCEPNNIFMWDYIITDDCVVLNQNVVERNLGVVLKGLEQIEI